MEILVEKTDTPPVAEMVPALANSPQKHGVHLYNLLIFMDLSPLAHLFNSLLRYDMPKMPSSEFAQSCSIDGS